MADQTIYDGIMQMREHYQYLMDLTNDTITSVYELPLTVTKLCRKLTMQEITDMTEEEVIERMKEQVFSSDEEYEACIQNLKTKYEALKEKVEEVVEEETEESAAVTPVPESFGDYLKDNLKKIRSIVLQANDFKEELIKLESDADKTLANRSARIAALRAEQLERMEKQLEEEPEGDKKKQIARKLKYLRIADDYSFLTERLEKYGEKEVKSILDSYFNRQRSIVIMNKFAAREKALGWEKNSYIKYYDIEEKFLPEEYADLNNIFLFHVMRYISYIDPYNKEDVLMANSVLVGMYKLIYHKFDSKEKEDQFIEVVKKVDDYFMPVLDKIAPKNTSSPNHPSRQESRIIADQKKRLTMIASLQDMGVDVDTSLETEELEALFNEEVEKLAAVVPEPEVVEEPEEVEEMKDEVKIVTDEPEEEIDLKKFNAVKVPEDTPDPFSIPENHIRDIVDGTPELDAVFDEMDMFGDEISKDLAGHIETLEKETEGEKEDDK